MRRTTKDYTVESERFGTITVPAGTATNNNTALGPDPNYNFVCEFGWVKPIDGCPQYILLHDLRHYGLNVPEEFFE